MKQYLSFSFVVSVSQVDIGMFSSVYSRELSPPPAASTPAESSQEKLGLERPISSIELK